MIIILNGNQNYNFTFSNTIYMSSLVRNNKKSKKSIERFANKKKSPSIFISILIWLAIFAVIGGGLFILNADDAR